MKKSAILSFYLLTVLTLSSCAGKNTDPGYYKSSVIEEMTREVGEDGYLEGFSDDLCVLPEDDIFDESLIDVKAAGLFSAAGCQVLYAKNAVEKIYPASLTKCMTALVVLNHIDDLDEEVVVGDEMYEGLTDGASLAGLISGASYSYRELLYALLVPSGNDAANTLAYHVSGSIEAFVDEMNAEAEKLGMVNTHFVNPHGMHDQDHYTTVYDLYLLINEVCKNNDFLDAAGQMKVSISADLNGESTVQEYTSGNSYLRGYTLPPDGLFIMASKTGYTVQAGRCLILALRNSEGSRYFAVICGADTYDALYEQMNAMLSIIGQ